MRKLMAMVVALAMMTLGFVVSVVVPTASAATYNACSKPLNLDRKKVYRLVNGTETLGYGRVVITPTKEYRHRYCIRFQTGGTTVTHNYSTADYRRLDGRCSTTQLGALSSGAYRTGSYSRTLKVPERTCVTQAYAIKSGTKWYVASFMRFRA